MAHSNRVEKVNRKSANFPVPISTPSGRNGDVSVSRGFSAGGRTDGHATYGRACDVGCPSYVFLKNFTCPETERVISGERATVRATLDGRANGHARVSTGGESIRDKPTGLKVGSWVSSVSGTLTFYVKSRVVGFPRIHTGQTHDPQGSWCSAK